MVKYPFSQLYFYVNIGTCVLWKFVINLRASTDGVYDVRDQMLTIYINGPYNKFALYPNLQYLLFLLWQFLNSFLDWDIYMATVSREIQSTPSLANISQGWMFNWPIGNGITQKIKWQLYRKWNYTEIKLHQKWNYTGNGITQERELHRNGNSTGNGITQELTNTMSTFSQWAESITAMTWGGNLSEIPPLHCRSHRLVLEGKPPSSLNF